MATGIKHTALALLLAATALAAGAQQGAGGATADGAKQDGATQVDAKRDGAKADGVKSDGASSDGAKAEAAPAATVGQPVIPHQRRGEHAVEPTTSVAQADARLLDVKEKRAVVEAAFADSERICYTKFFVNHCLDEAKEIRRAALVDLRAIEIEASHYKRAESVDRRDKALADSNETAAAQLAEREAVPAKPPKAAPVAAPVRKPATQTLAQRQAAHDAKIRQLQAQEAANADKRAANEASYAKNQADAIKRQQQVADKQAEKAEKARKTSADKAASAAVAADAAAAARKD